MRLTAYTLLVVILQSLALQTQAQGLVDGFMRGQRKASLAVVGSQDTYDSYYVGKTEIRNPNIGTVTTQALTVVGTYGLGYDLDLIVAVPYVRTEASAGYSPKQEGFQDISAALRWEAYDYKFGKLRVSWQFALGYSVPLQNYVNDALVAIGRGSRNLDARTLLHFKTGKFFLTGQYGYIRRGQVTLDHVVNTYDPGQVNPASGSTVNSPDVTDMSIRTGILTKPFAVDVWVQRQTPYNEGTDIGPGIPFPTNAVGFTRAGASAYLRLIGKLGLTAGYSVTLDGRNIGKFTRVTGGLVVGL